MFKRVVWMGMGAAAGSVATIWTQQKVKHQIDRVSEKATPKYLLDSTRNLAVDVRDTVVAAVSEGRTAKQDAESEMRQNLTDRWGR